MITSIPERWRRGGQCACARARVCIFRCRRGTEGGPPCLYVCAFVAVWASEVEQRAASRDGDEMDEVRVHAAPAAWRRVRVHVREGRRTPAAHVKARMAVQGYTGRWMHAHPASGAPRRWLYLPNARIHTHAGSCARPRFDPTERRGTRWCSRLNGNELLAWLCVCLD